MQSIVKTNGATPTSKRFQLPALEFKFASLTDGTNIPPPLPSPVEETPPPATVPASRAETPDASTSIDQEHDKQTSHSKAGTKRPADSPISPVSPTNSARPGSIRRLFSRNLLNQSYAEGEAAEPDSPGLRRPASQASFLTDKRPKRSSGWFRRLRGGGDGDSVVVDATKRSTAGSYEDVVGTVHSSRRPTGPPPPMIPELSALEAKVGLSDGSSLGTDLFKHIK